ncbi:MAG: DUF6580 family putative transport protein [Saprospiraceae bacterium]
MTNNKIELRTGIIIAIIALAALSRLLPHPPNFTPIAGIGLFGAAYFSRKWLALIIPFAAMWFSDLIINNVYMPMVYPEYYNGFTLFTEGWYWMYGSFALIILLGFNVLKKVKLGTLIGASLASSMIFFLVTNFGSWLTGPMYAKTAAGLIACYTAAIPFFWNTIAGDLFYVGLMFGVFALLQNRIPSLTTQRV